MNSRNMKSTRSILTENSPSFRNIGVELSISSKMRLMDSFWIEQFYNKHNDATKDADKNIGKVSSKVIITNEVCSSFSTNTKTIIKQTRCSGSHNTRSTYSKIDNRTSSTLTTISNILFAKRYYKTKDNQIQSEPCIFRLCRLPKVNTDIFKQNNIHIKRHNKHSGYQYPTPCYNSNVKCINMEILGSLRKVSKQNSNKTSRLSNSSSSFRTYINSDELNRNTNQHEMKSQAVYATTFQVYRHKLEPYECEPGVCIPGQCDPYECQKRINRRLARRTSTMTQGGSGSRASGTSSISPSQRAYKQQYGHYEPRHRGTHHRQLGGIHRGGSSGHKQAVRVGSSFNFNVEFYKDRSGGGGSHEDSVSYAGRREKYRRPVYDDRRRIKSSPSATTTRTITPRIKCTGTKCGVKPCVSRCTDVCNSKYRHGGSQSGPEMHHQGSMMSSKGKRCFCTLNLLKHGNTMTNQKGIEITTKNVPNHGIVFKTAGQNTKYKRHHGFKGLDPNECEPGICVPGQCDPHQCLKWINARNKVYKNYGTGMPSGSISTSSMAVYKPRRHRSHESGYHGRTRSQTSRPERHYESSASYPSRPSRQAVRIGSSFNFSVEFFKDKSGDGNYDVPLVDNRDYSHEGRHHRRHRDHRAHANRVRRTRSGRTQGDLRSITSSRSNQSGRGNRHRQAQTDTSTRHGATGTDNFLRRCFCTAKLRSKQHRPDKIGKHAKHARKKKHQKSVRSDDSMANIPPNLSVIEISGTGLTQKTSLEVDKKTMKNAAVVKIGGVDVDFKVHQGCAVPEVLKKYPDSGIKPIPKYKCAETCTYCRLLSDANNAMFANTLTQTKSTRDRKKHTKHNNHKTRNLLPYECEPGFCIPGQCDPYKCAERIKKRSTRVNTMSSTDRTHSKSMYSYAGSNSTSRSLVTRSPRYRSNYSTSRHSRPRYERPRYEDYPPSPSSGRNAVKIGSNFSFSIEFFKDSNNGSEKHHENERRRRINAMSGPNGPNHRRHGKNVSASVSVQDSLSQMDPVKKHHRGIGPMLRRCFCTLGLQNQGNKAKHKNVPKICTVTQGTDAPYCKVIPKEGTNNQQHVQTLPYKEKYHKLEPYECEPGICIPGQCNPHECIKLINKRLHKNAATGTQGKQYMDRDVQMLHPRHNMADRNVQHARRRRDANYGAEPYQSSQQRLSQNHYTPDTGRQSVRIGSSFNFSVEFFKDSNAYGDRKMDTGIKTNNGQELQRRRRRDGGVSTQPSRSNASINCDNRRRHHRMSQYDTHPNMRSTGSGAGLLKRCFCTLKLQNLPKQQTGHTDYKSKQRKAKYSDSISSKQAGTETRKIYPQVYPLLMPNECEPGFCVPDHCKPINCLKRIKERMKRGNDEEDLSLYECEPGICIPGQCDPYECLERMKKQGKLNKLGIQAGKDGFTQHSTGITGKHQGVTTQCKTKDYCLQTSQKTETKALAAKPLLPHLKRCFCTAKLLQQQAMKNRKKAFTIGRVDMIKTMTPFQPRFRYFTKSNETKLNVTKITSDNEDKLLNSKTSSIKLVFAMDNAESKSQRKEMETIWPYAPKRFERFASNTLCSTNKHHNDQNLSEQANKDNSMITKDSNTTQNNTQINEPINKDSGLQLNIPTDICKSDGPYENINGVSYKDYLKKSESERNPQNKSFYPRTSQSVKIPGASTSKSLYNKASKIKFSPLESGDAQSNKKPAHVIQIIIPKKKVPKRELIPFLSLKSNVKNFVAKVKGTNLIYKFKTRIVTMFRHRSGVIDMVIIGQKINIAGVNDNKSKKGLYDAGDTKYNSGDSKDTEIFDKPATNYNTERKQVNLPKKKMGIQFSLQGKRPTIQNANIFFKLGRNKIYQRFN